MRKQYQIDSATKLLVLEHQPEVPALGQIVLLHGLEGSATAGYIVSFAQQALCRGFGIHRVNFRTCGGTEAMCETTYHSGLTSDILAILNEVHLRDLAPRFVVGFSLGGNVALKLAGELGDSRLLSAACAVSTPIDLAACVRRIDKPSNLLYARRFLRRLRARARRKSKSSPQFYKTEQLQRVKTVWEFDDIVTAPLFHFVTAANYYETQSAARYLDAIRIPTLVICAKDDPLVPFEIYDHPAFHSNPALTLLVTEHGGHLGFISRTKPRFWLDSVILDWFEQLQPLNLKCGTKAEIVASPK